MAGRHRAGVSTALGGAFAAALLLSASAGDVGARPAVVLQQTDPGLVASVSTPVGSAQGAHPSVSGDGRHVVFQSAPEPVDGAEGDPARTSTVFHTDRETGATVELTPVPPGLRTGDTVHPVISGDGCAVVVVTELPLDVFRDDDTGERWDVYHTTLPHCGGAPGDWELVSSRQDLGGLARDDVVVAPPSLSRSGALVAYTHPADHLFDGGELSTISLVDLAVTIDDPGRSVLVAGMPIDIPDNTYTHVGLDQPALSDNGEFLAFRSDARSAEAVPVWGDGAEVGGPATRQVFVWERAEPDPFAAVRLVSARPDGSPSTGAGEPAVSVDGSSIAFVSADPALVAADHGGCTLNCPTQVYVLDRDADDNGILDEAGAIDLHLVSAATVEIAAGATERVAGDAPSSQPAISADGRLVAFVSKATNLQLIEASGVGVDDDGDLLLGDVGRGLLSRVTVGADGIVPAPAVHAHPDVSDTARTIVFDTLAAVELLGPDAAPGRQVVAHTAPPVLSLPDADLGTTVVGLESDEWFVAVVNDGPSSFAPATATISNAQFSINPEKTTCIAGNVVPPGGDCVVAFRFTPTRPGATSATVTVAEDGFGAVSVSSRLAGGGGEPTLRIESNEDFGEQEVGTTSVEYLLDVSNISFVPTRVASVELGGSHPADFAVTSNNCAGRPLNPRASCTIGVTFTPTEAGRRTALVTVATPSGQYTTMVIAGDGLFAPEVRLAAPEVVAGAATLLGGSKYPPNSEVTVVFGDGPGDSITVTTDEAGEFFIGLPVRPDERGGERTIVVQSANGAAASVPVEVIESTPGYVGMPGFGMG